MAGMWVIISAFGRPNEAGVERRLDANPFLQVHKTPGKNRGKPALRFLGPKSCIKSTWRNGVPMKNAYN
jgi:hypothetical protein